MTRLQLPPIICAVCGNSIDRERRWRDRFVKNHFCSGQCRSVFQKGLQFPSRPSLIAEEAPHALRIRANGLINKWIKLGHLIRPKTCARCSKGCRPDAHHPDYSQPGLVAFVCRSCHMLSHYNPEIKAQLASLARWVGRRAA